MKYSITVAVAVVALSFLGADIADAKRLGAGRSIGTQRQAIAPPPAAAPAPTTPGAAANPVMPAPAASAARPATPPPATPPASGASRWLGPIAGIAAGLGLAALMSHLGLSEAFGSVLLIALLVIAAVVLVRLIFARRMTPAYRGEGNSGYPNARAEPTMRFEPALGGRADMAAAPTGPSFPAGFNPEPFLQQAKVQFRRLQTAYDNADRRTLADVMTPEMYAEVARDLDQRGVHVPTDVVALDAEIREVIQEGDRYVASVKFTGALREDGASEAKPFVEVWNLVKPVDGSSGWMLAGIQQNEDSLVAQ